MKSLTGRVTVPVTLILLLSLALGAPQIARAQPPSPIQIQTCTILPWQRVRPPFWNPFDLEPLPVSAPITDGIRIVYVNRGPIAADRVRFVVDYRGEVERIVDAGKFSPNVKIDHTFSNFSGQAYLGPTPNYCRVNLVRFMDGTVWRLPS